MIKFIENLDKYNAKNNYSIFIKQYFGPILKNGTKKYIKNIEVDIKIIEVNGTLIPLSIGNNNSNCYTSSISGTFKYLLIELKHLNNRFFKFFVYLVSKFLFFVIKKSELDNIIFVNNLLLSTNLYPKLSKIDLKEIKTFLLKTYPNYAIIYRSINDFDNYYLNSLSKIGFKRIISRQIYISERKFLNKYLNIRNVKNDKRFFEKGNYKFETKNNFNKKEYKEILDCYNNLYIKKYTSLNPQLTITFLKNISKNNNFTFNILKYNNNIKAVFGYYKISDTITTPIFGYKEQKLYKQISYLLLINSLKTVEILNSSSGVGEFKMNRGAKKYIEYSMLYYKHLSLHRRIIWSFIHFLSSQFGEKNLKNNVY